MTTHNRSKKPAPEDWHRADIVAALRKAGWSLRRLATHHGYAAPTTLTNALARPWPKGEQIIAEAIGEDPAAIWPSRYREDSGRARHASPELRQRHGSDAA
ncbi:helix-turn-helix domain-containing protein [Arhodomonas sp. AD133]|uniref:helix-turn-helix domain-containing protein n=1 Tax=Arhodomonas sp. AD133 TaxID=3415009 RepID=UPI003EC1216F